MKKQTFPKQKLTLLKRTISNLEIPEMMQHVGGVKPNGNLKGPRFTQHHHCISF